MPESSSAAPEAPPPPSPRYRTLRELGRGGAGIVLLAHDELRGEDVALKILSPNASALCDVADLRREFSLLAHLEHPALAQAVDFGITGDRPWFTYRFVRGEPLSSALERPLAPPDIASALADIVDALAFLHERDLLHLDVKPANIIAERREGSLHATLIDFGLCRRGVDLTVEDAGRAIRGSLPYMAPECFDGRPLGPWTDIYALGVTFYRLLCGRLPRPGASALLRDCDSASAWAPAPVPPSALAPNVPRDLELLLLRALALDPQSRFSSASELSESLRGLAQARTHRVTSPARTYGRSVELAQTSRFLDDLGEGRGSRALVITSVSGAGATRFLREVQIQAQTRGFSTWLETGYPGEARAPGTALRFLIPLLATDDPEAGEGWGAFLDRLSRPRSPLPGEASDRERRIHRATRLFEAVDRLRRPALLIVDGLQHLDEISIGLIVDLARWLTTSPSDKRPRLGIIASLREEGEHAELVRELSRLHHPGARILTLRPLEATDALALWREMRAPEKAAIEPSAIEIFTRTEGLPDRIVEDARGSQGEDRGSRRETHEAPSRAERAPTSDAQDVLRTLELLRRPADPDEIAAIHAWPHARAKAALDALAELPGSHGSAWTSAAATMSRASATGTMSPPDGSAMTPRTSRRGLLAKRHLRIARALLERSGERPGPLLVEAARHLLVAGSRSQAVRYGLIAADWLRSTSQNRAALDLLERISSLVSEREVRVAHEIALSLADLRTQTGELERAIDELRAHLARPETRRLPRVERWRGRLRLGTLHAKRGDFSRADALFRETFAEMREASPDLSRVAASSSMDASELLWFLNERAALAGFLGAHDEALALCDEGLRLAGRSRARRVREAALNFHATRANVHLRRFEHDDAVRAFERALATAEAIGSEVNRAVILNNLGIVRLQLEQIDEAASTLEEALQACKRLDDGPSLLSILCNLAVLEARRGRKDECEAALHAAERLGPSAMGRRQELFVDHSAGLCELHLGRPWRARPRLERAVELARSAGDEHLARHDEVWLAEVLMHEGKYTRSLQLLDGALARDDGGDRIRRSALARRSLVLAWMGRSADALADLERYEELASGAPFDFFRGADALAAGYAAALAGRPQSGHELLVKAIARFEETRLSYWRDYAMTLRAEIAFLAGDADHATSLLESRSPSDHALAAVIDPLLRARLHLESPGPRSESAAADALARAGAALAGASLPEWELRLEWLRSSLSGGRASPSEGSSRGPVAIFEGLSEIEREAWDRAAFRRKWLDVPTTRDAGTQPADGGASADDVPTEDLSDTVPISRDGVGARPRIIARSLAMRRLMSTIDRIRDSELPVLIRGETGSGKELVSRAIHAKSPRAKGPFRVIDCAALPTGVIDAELFGVRAGAFTDAAADREGLIALARGGTVLIDDVADLPLEVQAKLLRVVESRSVRRLGGEHEEEIDVRFIFATTHDLEREVRDGSFRSDLYHRLAVVRVDVPSLRERLEDLRPLAELILIENGFEEAADALDDRVVAALGSYAWPGNVRELGNVLLRAAIEGDGTIDPQRFPQMLRDATSTVFPRHLFDRLSLELLRTRLESDYLRHHLHRLGGDVDRLAEFLQTSRRQLYRRLERAGISIRAERRRMRKRAE